MSLTIELDPTDLGFFEKRAGSGVWYKNEAGAAYEPKACETCDEPFMGVCKPGGQRFCSVSCANRKAEIKYGSQHMRVRRERGPASGQTCVDCGQQAEQWSRVHGTSGNESEHFEARCLSCHYYGYDAEIHGIKLTEDAIRAIRTSGEMTQRELADLYQVDQSSISLILNNKSWRHVK